jgi:hypothetical protein
MLATKFEVEKLVWLKGWGNLFPYHLFLILPGVRIKQTGHGGITTHQPITIPASQTQPLWPQVDVVIGKGGNAQQRTPDTGPESVLSQKIGNIKGCLGIS